KERRVPGRTVKWTGPWTRVGIAEESVPMRSSSTRPGKPSSGEGSVPEPTVHRGPTFRAHRSRARAHLSPPAAAPTRRTAGLCRLQQVQAHQVEPAGHRQRSYRVPVAGQPHFTHDFAE